MRRAARTDALHAAIVRALRAAGCSVLSLAAVGHGCPDLLVGYRGRMWLMEVKAPAGPAGGKSAHGQRLNAEQTEWHARWRGPAVRVVRSVGAALAATAPAGER